MLRKCALIGIFCGIFQAEVRAEEPKIDESYPMSAAFAPHFTDPIFSTSKVSIQVVNLRTKEETFAYNAEDKMIPASVMKAVTSAAALRILGPSFRFETKVYTDGEIKKGVLKGDLYIKGGGDPSLEVHHLWKMAHDLKSLGISKIEGNVYYDNTLFGEDRFIPGWGKPIDIANGPAYFPLISSLSLNYNCVALRVRSGDKVKESAQALNLYFKS